MVAAITRAEIDEGKQADADDEDHDHGLAYPEHWGGDWTNATPGCIKFAVDDVIEDATSLLYLVWSSFSDSKLT